MAVATDAPAAISTKITVLDLNQPEQIAAFIRVRILGREESDAVS